MTNEVQTIIDIIMGACEKISFVIKISNTISLSEEEENINNSGDIIKKIDAIANEILTYDLRHCPLVKKVASEEENYFITTQFDNAKYLVCFDPLDGSSNVGINITTGTIFGIFKYDDNDEILDGNNIVASGYSLYSGATQIVICNNQKVSLYQLIKDDGFILIHDNLQIPKNGKIYSINESQSNNWIDNRYNKLIKEFKENNYSTRWVGSLVADAHRTLLKGGFFAYPANTSNKEGKIRLLYEAYPYAHIFKVADGRSSNGVLGNILDIPFPKNIHQKIPIILSSPDEYINFISLV